MTLLLKHINPFVMSVVYLALTTVAFDYELMGMKAASYLLAVLRGGTGETNMDMPLLFVERECVQNLNKNFLPENTTPLPAMM